MMYPAGRAPASLCAPVGGRALLHVAAAAVMCGLAALAMPTRDELIQAQKIVEDLTADDVRAMKSGAKKPGEVAATAAARNVILLSARTCRTLGGSTICTGTSGSGVWIGAATCQAG